MSRAFICGAGIPLALTRRMQGGHAGWTYWRHVLWRFVELNFLGAGAATAAVGVALHFVQAEIKHIYTPSYTLISAGICLALLGAFYWLFDVRGVRKGTWLCVLYGQFSLASYMFWGLFGKSMRHASEGMLGGVEKLLLPESYHSFVTTCGTLFLSTSLLSLWLTSRSRA